MSITLSEKDRHGYIKDYDGGTLMQCVLYPKVDYLNITGMVQRQRTALKKAADERAAFTNKVYPGLTIFDVRTLICYSVLLCSLYCCLDEK